MVQSQIQVSLRLTGNDLIPDLISSVLCCEPTEGRKKGEEIESKKFVRKAPTGVWLLRSTDGQTVDEAIEALMNSVVDDIKVWSELTKLYRAEFFIGLFSDTNTAGLTISATVMQRVSKLGISISLDVYCNQ